MAFILLVVTILMRNMTTTKVLIIMKAILPTCIQGKWQVVKKGRESHIPFPHFLTPFIPCHTSQHSTPTRTQDWPPPTIFFIELYSSIPLAPPWSPMASPMTPPTHLVELVYLVKWYGGAMPLLICPWFLSQTLTLTHPNIFTQKLHQLGFEPTTPLWTSKPWATRPLDLNMLTKWWTSST